MRYIFVYTGKQYFKAGVKKPLSVIVGVGTISASIPSSPLYIVVIYYTIFPPPPPVECKRQRAFRKAAFATLRP